MPLSPDAQKALDQLEKINETVDKAKDAKDERPPDFKKAEKLLEDAIKQKHDLVKSLPDVAGLPFWRWYQDLHTMDSLLAFAKGGFSYGTDEHKKQVVNEWIRDFERWKKPLEKALKNPEQEKK